MAATEKSSSRTVLRSLSPSPTGLNHTLRFPLHRSMSSVVSRQKPPKHTPTCLCSPTTHSGSFRCARHRRSETLTTPTPTPIREFLASNGLNLRKSAVVNSLARIRGVEGELAKSIMAAVARQSSQNLRSRAEFRPRPSRFSVMYKDQSL